MGEAFINPEIVKWAFGRSGISSPELAQSLNVKVEKVENWLQGKVRPTFNQAKKIAHFLKVPFGYFFLPHPPIQKLPIPDLRTIEDRDPKTISPDLYDLMLDVLRKQSWFKEYLQDQGAGELDFVGKFANTSNVGTISNAIVTSLDLKLEDREKAPNWEFFLQSLIEKAESAGIWVMKSGVVENNTHRPLNVNEFRGFAIADHIAPIVFINGKDARAAQIFTLVHELAHIWIGQSGISDLSLETVVGQINDVERFCNEIASEVLVPENSLTEKWNKGVSLEENAHELAKYFKVSTVMLARRALQLNFIGKKEYFDFYRREKEKWTSVRSGGGDYYLNIPVRNGKHFTDAVVWSAVEGKTLLREAGKLLNINPSKIFQLAEVRRQA